jgi:phosphotriesterase-related protein
LVDATTFDLGRDIELLAEVARAAEFTILASTGHWLMPSPTMLARTADQLTDLFTRDLNDGADGTSITAAVIKVASQDEITPFEERVLEAAARAHAATGAPIITHAYALKRIGEGQAAVLERFGVDPSRVVIGHSDDTYELDYVLGLADRGYMIGMDRIPNGRLPEYGGRTVDDRIDLIMALVERGHADRIVVSHDDPIWAGLLTEEDQARHLESNPDLISFIPRVVIPALRDRGLAAADISRLTVDNPRAWLTGTR